MTTESLENICGFESSSFSIDLDEIYTSVCGGGEFVDILIGKFCVTLLKCFSSVRLNGFAEHKWMILAFLIEDLTELNVLQWNIFQMNQHFWTEDCSSEICFIRLVCKQKEAIFQLSALQPLPTIRVHLWSFPTESQDKHCLGAFLLSGLSVQPYYRLCNWIFQRCMKMWVSELFLLCFSCASTAGIIETKERWK